MLLMGVHRSFDAFDVCSVAFPCNPNSKFWRIQPSRVQGQHVFVSTSFVKRNIVIILV